MPVPLSRNAFVRLFAIVVVLLLTRAVVAQTVWLPLFPFTYKQFTKAAGSDHTLPENQDALTFNVILTRGSSGGLINIAAETTFDPFTSPQGTEWATSLNNPGKNITVRNWENLSFTNWLGAYGDPDTIGSMITELGAVVHLVPDNIYLYLQFNSWDVGDGGGYSYFRTTSTHAYPWTGDYNRNGMVDAADYVIWRDTLDRYLPQIGAGGDGNADGIADAADYDLWKRRFGNTVSSAAGANEAAAVPEPTIGVQLVLGWLMLKCLSIRTVYNRSKLTRRA